MKNNKVIAEFMGASFNDKGMTRICGKFGLERVSDLNLKYHTSWDWLMPVVGKLLDQDEFYGASDHSYRLKDALVETNIDSMYKIVVEFINKCNWKSNMNDNKLIAEFMGHDTYESNGYIMVRYSDNNERTLQDTHYHTSWDWLMPVIEEIDHSQIETVKVIEDALATRVIGDVYKAVLEFIINKYKN